MLAGIYLRHVRILRLGQQSVSTITAAKVIPPVKQVEDPTVKVWVNTNSGTFHCPGTRWYGKTQQGEFMTQKQAREKGFHPAANHACM